MSSTYYGQSPTHWNAPRYQAARREPHTHYCEAGEHRVEHGIEPCGEPLRRGYVCPSCLDIIRDNERRLAKK